jgi:pimeloyl-ACP methyl ester carboxylesterase
MARVHCLTFTGLMGSIYSRGMYDLHDKLYALPKTKSKLFSYSDLDEAGDYLDSVYKKGDGVILIGHSLGGGAITQLANLVYPIPIDALYGFDPAGNIWASMSSYKIVPVPDSVALAESFYATFGLGQGKYEAVNPKKTKVHNIRVSGSHVGTASRADIHTTIVNLAKKLSA